MPTNNTRTKTTQKADEDIFTAIAHPVRRQILEVLISGDLTVTQLTEPFGVTRSAISQHLGILFEVGLVTREKHGREQVYHLEVANLNEVQRWINHFERLWPEKLDKLSAYLDSIDEDRSPRSEANGA